MSDIEQRVKKIVCEQLGSNEADVKSESSFVDDLGADSLDTVGDGFRRGVRHRDS